MRKLSFILANIWLVLIFLFNPHYIDLSVLLDTWFSYKGLVYYRDIPTFHFPLGRVVALPLHLLTNWNLAFDPLLGLLVGMLTLYVIYRFSKDYLSEKASCISLIYFSFLFWYYSTGVQYFIEMLIGLLIALDLYLLFKIIYSKKIKTSLIVSFGILLSLTELSGQISTITVFCIFLIAAKSIISKKTISSLFIYIISSLTPVLILALIFIKIGAIESFFKYNFLYYLDYAKYQQSNSLLDLPLNQVLLFYIPLGLLIINIIIKRFKNFNRESLLILLSLSTIPFILFSVYHPHHYLYALPILALSFGFAIENIGKNKISLILMGVFVYMLLTSVVPWHLERIQHPSLKIANNVYPGDDMYKSVEWIRNNTPTKARLLVVGDSLFYFSSDRLPSARASTDIPYLWEPFKEVKQELIREYPNYWIIDSQYLDKLSTVYLKKDMVNFIKEQINQCYKEEVRFGNWQIWSRTCN